MNHDCSHFPACGGCQILDLGYAEQLLLKEDDLRRQFSDWQGLRIDSVLPSPRTYGYRHKVQLPFGVENRGGASRVTVGCYAAGSHLVVDQRECLVQEPDLSRVAWAVRDWAEAHSVPIYREVSGEGWLRHLILRKGSGTGEILLGLVTNGPGAGPRGTLAGLLERCRRALGSGSEGGKLVGVIQNLNAGRNNVVLGGEERVWWGSPRLRENLGGFSFSVGASTFFQVNPFQTPRLYDLAMAEIAPGAAVLDLYSGIGSISLWASRTASSVLGIEENPASVAAARLSARENGVENARFLAADVGAALAAPENLDFRADAVVVDPPRKGLEPAVRTALERMRVPRLVYVSCFPPTLARDARALAGAYRLESIAPVDMFPHTRHVECVAVFTAR